MSTNNNHVCFNCGQSTIGLPDEISFWYMHDNHTFSKLSGSLDCIVKQAKEIAKKSPYGMLCNPTLLRQDKEVRRLHEVVHATLELGDTTKWEAEIMADVDARRLLHNSN